MTAYFIWPGLCVAQPDELGEIAHLHPDAEFIDSVEGAVELRAAGGAAVVPSFESATEVLIREGWDPKEVEFRIAYVSGTLFASPDYIPPEFVPYDDGQL